MKPHAYYNEKDSFAAGWLRELIKENLIAPGDVDERSIEEVVASDLVRKRTGCEPVPRYSQCHFFAGIGVWSYALRAAGWPDDSPVWTGSCPCQGFSASGKRGGFSDKRNLWPAWFRLIRQCRPDAIFGEQVASKDGVAWWDVVASDLEGIDYSVGPTIAPACGFGAYQRRKRIYFVACTASRGWEGWTRTQNKSERLLPVESSKNGKGRVWNRPERIQGRSGKSYAIESGVEPLAAGAPARVGRLRGYGNALCAPQAIAFIEAYLETCRRADTPTR